MSAEAPRAGVSGGGLPGDPPPGDVLPVPPPHRPRLVRPRLHLRLSGGGLIGRAIDLTLLAVIVALAATSIILIYGFISSGGSQPAQLEANPSPSFNLMPLGNAHIPTTNARVLCHAPRGEVKTPPQSLAEWMMERAAVRKLDPQKLEEVVGKIQQ